MSLMDGRLGCVYMFCFINRENSYWNLFTTLPWCSGQKNWFLITSSPSYIFKKYPDLDHIPLSQHSPAFPFVAASLISHLLKCGHWICALTPLHRAEIPQEVSLIPEVNDVDICLQRWKPIIWTLAVLSSPANTPPRNHTTHRLDSYGRMGCRQDLFSHCQLPLRQRVFKCFNRH